MLDTLLILAVLAALALASAAAIRVRHLADLVVDHDLQLGAVRDRAGVTDNDVDDYHDRIHPDCAETGGPS